jgi:YebC/PmpR family DNA-binding regulatory protein
MAGHSKWANIQHRKGAQDKKRGKLFTKLIREITMAARLGGGDPNANPRLRLALDKAFSGNMSKDTVERAIKRGAGGLEDNDVEEIRYEGYGPSGVAVMVDCITNNRNRTVAEVRHAFTKSGGNLGADGSVSYLFQKRGQMSFAPGGLEEKITELALEANAEDVIVNEDFSIDVFTTPEGFSATQQLFLAHQLKPDYAEVTLVPNIYVDLDVENGEKMTRLIDILEDLEDVQEVYTNANVGPVYN